MTATRFVIAACTLSWVLGYFMMQYVNQPVASISAPPGCSPAPTTVYRCDWQRGN